MQAFPTLDKHAMRAIIDYLDAALAETRKGDGPTLECNASWNIRMARNRLLEAAIGDITIEQAAA